MMTHRRIWATVGLVYMLAILAINFYALSTGSLLYNLFPLFMCPVICGLGFSSFCRLRAGTMGKAKGLLSIGVCVVALVLCLWTGIPLLLMHFR